MKKVIQNAIIGEKKSTGQAETKNTQH